MKRAVTVEQLINTEFSLIDFNDQWAASFGKPEVSGVWIFWGDSGNGKTRFAMQLARELTKYGKVCYDSLEEGARLSMKRAVIAENMISVARKFLILHREPIEDIIMRLAKRRSPDVIFIDSYQYSGLTKRTYIELKEKFPKKLFIFLSHAEGKHPEGRSAKFVRYDADIKGRIEGYKVFPVSRYGGGEPYVIWDEGAGKYWGIEDHNN
ncbi:MAG: ATP-binding protein [Bacteroidales bacterium]|nr:ATP-binding protein [Bacteroidales bacterium]